MYSKVWYRSNLWIPNMLSDLECDKIIELSKDKVKRSTVIGDLYRDISNVEQVVILFYVLMIWSTNEWYKSKSKILLVLIKTIMKIYKLTSINPVNF